ncbi:MAG: hypothetical protein ACFFEV_01955 [Candidatus Thorarchaeota archaeon]
MTWKEHIRNIEDIRTDETPTPRIFEVIRYMLDKPIAIPRRVLEDYIGSTIESAWDTVLVTKATEKMFGKESEWKNVNWVAHTDKESMPWISFVTIDMGE